MAGKALFGRFWQKKTGVGRVRPNKLVLVDFGRQSCFWPIFDRKTGFGRFLAKKIGFGQFWPENLVLIKFGPKNWVWSFLVRKFGLGQFRPHNRILTDFGREICGGPMRALADLGGHTLSVAGQSLVQRTTKSQKYVFSICF